MGSKNRLNVVKATIAALQKLRSKEQIMKVRGVEG
jgi:ribosomal protein S5